MFTIDFLNKVCIALIPVEVAIAMSQRLVFDFQNAIPNAHFIIELLGLVLRNSLMSFDREYFQKLFGIIKGTNIGPILANIYMAMLENELRRKCALDPSIKMPILF